MYVYAKDKTQNGFMSCITLEECKKYPWRWEYVQDSPGQDEEKEKVEVVEAPKTITYKRGKAKE